MPDRRRSPLNQPIRPLRPTRLPTARIKAIRQYPPSSVAASELDPVLPHISPHRRPDHLINEDAFGESESSGSNTQMVTVQPVDQSRVGWACVYQESREVGQAILPAPLC